MDYMSGLYLYKWHLHFLCNYKNDTDSKLQIENISFNVKPHSNQDEYPMLINTYLLRPIPLRIRLSFIYIKTIYAFYLFFDFDKLSSIFRFFYGAHPETKTDFIIRIDAENKKYELALYRQGLKEPVVIPESAYQLIVFKNKFEDYRSENYNQPRGAWIW